METTAQLVMAAAVATRAQEPRWQPKTSKRTTGICGERTFHQWTSICIGNWSGRMRNSCQGGRVESADNKKSWIALVEVLGEVNGVFGFFDVLYFDAHT